MYYFTKISTLLLGASLFLGCSGKSFTLQSYADEHFNTKEKSEAGTTKSDKAPYVETTNSSLKSGPGSDIAWSSTYKQDEKMEGKGAMQKSLDEWTEKEWESAFEGDIEQVEKDKAANEHFTIQHYIDKSKKYLDKKEKEKEGKPQEPSHYEKMKSMPVIGE